jgi:hypothetical protein
MKNYCSSCLFRPFFLLIFFFQMSNPAPTQSWQRIFMEFDIIAQNPAGFLQMPDGSFRALVAEQGHLTLFSLDETGQIQWKKSFGTTTPLPT